MRLEARGSLRHIHFSPFFPRAPHDGSCGGMRTAEGNVLAPTRVPRPLMGRPERADTHSVPQARDGIGPDPEPSLHVEALVLRLGYALEITRDSPPRSDCRSGFPHGPNDHLRRALLLSRHPSRPSAHLALPRHLASWNGSLWSVRPYGGPIGCARAPDEWATKHWPLGESFSIYII